MGRLSSLQELDLSDNRLTGEIPPELASLNLNILLDLSNNRLTGEIPDWQGSFYSGIGDLDLSGNQLTGEIPDSLGHSGLSRLDLSGNRLTGEIPDSLEYLRSVDLSGNRLTGGNTGLAQQRHRAVPPGPRRKPVEPGKCRPGWAASRTCAAWTSQATN